MNKDVHEEMYTLKNVHKILYIKMCMYSTHTIAQIFLHTIRSVHRVVLKEYFIHKCELCTHLKMCMCIQHYRCTLYSVHLTLYSVVHYTVGTLPWFSYGLGLSYQKSFFLHPLLEPKSGALCKEPIIQILIISLTYLLFKLNYY